MKKDFHYDARRTHDRLRYIAGWLERSTFRTFAQELREIADGMPTPQFSEQQIKYMRDRFLNWTLPHDLNPDGGISYKRSESAIKYNHPGPVGTNFLDAVQAEAMVRYMIDGMQEAATPAPGEVPACPLCVNHPKHDGQRCQRLSNVNYAQCECLGPEAEVPAPLRGQAFRDFLDRNSKIVDAMPDWKKGSPVNERRPETEVPAQAAEALDIPALLRLCEKATPEPWAYAQTGSLNHNVLASESDGEIWIVAKYVDEVNAPFITAARTALPIALRRIQALEAQVGLLTMQRNIFENDAYQLAAQVGELKKELAARFTGP